MEVGLGSGTGACLGGGSDFLESGVDAGVCFGDFGVVGGVGDGVEVRLSLLVWLFDPTCEDRLPARDDRLCFLLDNVVAVGKGSNGGSGRGWGRGAGGGGFWVAAGGRGFEAEDMGRTETEVMLGREDQLVRLRFLDPGLLDSSDLLAAAAAAGEACC